MQSSPTCNRALPLRLGGFPSLREALDYAAQGDTGVSFFDSRGDLAAVLDYRTLRANALAAARWMRAQGIREGDRFGLIADTSPGFLTLFYAAQYAGAVPCPLPYSAYPGAREGYVARLRHLLMRTQARWVFAPEGALSHVRNATPGLHAFAFDHATAGYADGEPGEESHGKPTARDDIPAYVQFSSGSTAEPKGVVVRQSALMANATAIAVHGLRMGADDRACSWLPLYHDMGLVGFSVVAMCSQRSVDYLSPATFAARPTVWLRLMAQQRTTIAYAPCFAWKLAAQRYRGEPHVDLSALRVAGVGGDMVQPAMLDECATALAGTGFRFGSFQPSYGMAEATLAVCMSDADDAPRIDRPASGAGGARENQPHRAPSAGATHAFVSCGAPLPGMEVRVEDDDGALCPPGQIGRIRVRGPSVMEGYLNDPEASRRVLGDDGYLDTGDLGYCLDGELFLAGRAKDMILIRGGNLWPQDIEWMAERISPLASGDTAAIGVPDANDGERLVLLVQRGIESRDERRALRDALVDAIAGTWGVVARVVFVPPRSLPLTSSGKLARAHARTRYLAGAWDEPNTSRPSAEETVA